MGQFGEFCIVSLHHYSINISESTSSFRHEMMETITLTDKDAPNIELL